MLLLTLSGFFIVSCRILRLLHRIHKSKYILPVQDRGVLSFRFCFLNLLVAPSSLSPSLSPSRLASRRLRRDDRHCPFLPLCFPPRLAASPAARGATRALHAQRPGPRCTRAGPQRTVHRNPRYRGRRAQGPLTCGLPQFVPEVGSFASSTRRGPGPAFAPSWSAGPSLKVLRSSIAPASCSSLLTPGSFPTLLIFRFDSGFIPCCTPTYLSLWSSARLYRRRLTLCVLPLYCSCTHRV